MNRFFVGGLCCLGLLLALREEAAARSRRARRPAEEARLSHVGPEARTRGRRDGWSEALPGQALPPRSQIEAGLGEGVEIELGERGRLQLGPGSLMALDRTPRGRAAGAVRLLRGTLRVELGADAGPLSVRTRAVRLQVQGAAVIQATDEETMLAVHGGEARARARGREAMLAAGQGLRVSVGERPAVRTLPQVPAWEGDAHRLLLARGPLVSGGLFADGELPFRDAPGAESYIIEIAGDGRFNQVRTRTEVGSSPYRARLAPGEHHLRVTAVGADRLLGPPSAPLVVYVAGLRTDAEEDADRQDSAVLLHLQRPLAVKLELLGGGAPLRARVDDEPEVDCKSGHIFSLGPGVHRVHISAGDARGELRVSVAPPRPPPPLPPLPPVIGPAPVGLPVPLATAGAPTRALHPRTRAYAMLGVGGSGPGRSADVYRLDLGGEVAFFRDSFSLDANLPILYQRAAADDETGGAALGDFALGFRAVALRVLGGRLALGPLLRLQLPTGTFLRPDYPGSHPVILDPALALAGVLGPVALLTTQGPTAVLAVPSPALRWNMSYTAEVRLGWLSVIGELDAALGMGGTASGAALGGALRAQLPNTPPRLGRWSLLIGARGALGARSEALYGRYQAGVGIEWRLK